MSTKQINYESEYKSLKNQYDSLLEKNQNDLIKIKQKEKHLSVPPSLFRKNSIASRTKRQPLSHSTPRSSSPCTRRSRAGRGSTSRVS
jgi:hypothetical protein